MGRTLRTDVPQLPAVYEPEWQYLKDFRQREEKYREDQKRNYDDHHRTKTLVELPDNCPVWVDMPPNGQVPGDVVSTVAEPRSYTVRLQSGQVRRNRSQLREREASTPGTRTEASSSHSEPSRIQTRSRTGVTLRCPLRYIT